MKHLAALVPNRLGVSPGQRARIELWSRHLEGEGWTVTFHPFEDDGLHEVLYCPGRYRTKAARMLTCYGRHVARVVGGLAGDVYYIYREAAMVGPALTERVLAARGRPVVYDLDDPAWIRYRSPANGWMSVLKFSGKTRSLIRMSDRVLAINEPIATYARPLNPAVTVVPNLIDTDVYRPSRERGDGQVRVGWIGSYSTVDNLQAIARPLAGLQRRTGATVRVIAPGAVDLPGVHVEFEPWAADTEVARLGECDIGVVPLSDNRWNPWKFFLKTVQYMALGLPVVARRMGSNPEVVTDGVDGFLVDSEAEWLDRLEVLVRDAPRREGMGRAARDTVVRRYSVDSQMPRVLQVFDDLVAGR